MHTQAPPTARDHTNRRGASEGEQRAALICVFIQQRSTQICCCQAERGDDVRAEVPFTPETLQVSLWLGFNKPHVQGDLSIIQCPLIECMNFIQTSERLWLGSLWVFQSRCRSAWVRTQPPITVLFLFQPCASAQPHISHLEHQVHLKLPPDCWIYRLSQT